ncbi:MAG: hypothetical protein NUV80_00910 [Candidatus Berkelbacteria bacterium]|nr:hypothetical protein [Candidatus Berkelbacteria bacterium]
MSQDPTTKLVTEWLQDCYLLLESGEEERIERNLNYQSPMGVLTDDYVDRVIEAIDKEFVYELEKYPEYHAKNADGANYPPEFWRLSPESRRAVVEGIHKILFP